MIYPLLRPDERPKSRDDRVGVRVTYFNGVVHFFPGGTPQMAMAMAGLVAPKDKLDHPATRIEFGWGRPNVWVVEEVLKPGVTDAIDPK